MEQEKIIEEMYNDIPDNIEIDGKDILTILEILAKKNYRKVIMCKDCKYFYNENFKACTHWNGHATVETNYCSCAKMKGE